jgi:hypothetical protein
MPTPLYENGAGVGETVSVEGAVDVFLLLNDESLFLPLLIPGFFDWYEFCWS